jgi:hypothetical protein
MYRRRDRLVVRRSQLDVRSPRAIGQGNKLVVGIDGGTGHEFALTVQSILEAWQFPGDPRVGFDLAAHDIRVNGKDRRANGKGVRALLHAAFKIGVLVFCRSRNLPHPGFVVLDNPLLTYREPLQQARHGPLAPDEQALKASALNRHFYSYLDGIRDLGQVLVLENADPPVGLQGASVTIFTGGEDEGRFGFFPISDDAPRAMS